MHQKSDDRIKGLIATMNKRDVPVKLVQQRGAVWWKQIADPS